jgi:uncharacterized RDD family membrane protein YckC
MATTDDEERSGLANAAGRAAFFPARAAARAWRGSIEEAVDEVLSTPELARVIDRAFAGPLPEEVARSLVRHRVVERIVSELAQSGELERLVAAALASPRTLEATDRVLASEQMQHALNHVASSPELRHAVRRQTSSLTEEVVGGMRETAARMDGRAEHAVSRRTRAVRPPEAGVVTRALALAIDAGATLVAYMALVGLTSLIASLVGNLRPAWLAGLLLTAAWFLIVVPYFILCWSTAGQTPGMRVLRLRVQRLDGTALSVGRAAVRVVGLVLSIVPVFAGFVPVLFSDRRRGLADYLAGTVVVYDEVQGVP